MINQSTDNNLCFMANIHIYAYSKSDVSDTYMPLFKTQSSNFCLSTFVKISEI